MTACQNLWPNARLATAETMEENMFIATLSGSNKWIGVGLTVQSTFSNGTSVDYSPWASGYPGLCVVAGKLGAWSSVPCNTLNYSVCERKFPGMLSISCSTLIIVGSRIGEVVTALSFPNIL